MNTLDKIIAHKEKEVQENKALYPVKLLEKSIYFNTPTVSLKKYLKREDKLGVIAEFKRKSPSKGLINPQAKVEEVSIGYMQAGASALSVLTDKQFFGGSRQDLETARKYNFCPILRKDFVIDEYQLFEARAMGADVILLIAECLEKNQLQTLAQHAKALGLEVLMEVHSADQLDKLCPEIDVVGVNNRDLKTFNVDVNRSKEVAAQIPSEFLKISESGLADPKVVADLKAFGFNGFLIGETFMKHARPQDACARFINAVQSEIQNRLEPCN
jgi:indole-3-glycerol phosphate synthase